MVRIHTIIDHFRWVLYYNSGPLCCFVFKSHLTIYGLIGMRFPFLYDCNCFLFMSECLDGDVRIVKETRFIPQSDSVGRAEICDGGQWKMFCSIGMDIAGAIVFCRQLGYDSIGTV